MFFELVPGHCLSSELPAFEHHKLWYLQTQFRLPGERSLPIGLLVFVCRQWNIRYETYQTGFYFWGCGRGQNLTFCNI